MVKASLLNLICFLLCLIFLTVGAFEPKIARFKVSRNGSVLASRDDKYRDFDTCKAVGQCLSAGLRIGPQNPPLYNDISSLQQYGADGDGWIQKDGYDTLEDLDNFLSSIKWTGDDFEHIVWDWNSPTSFGAYDAWFSKKVNAIIVETIDGPENPMLPSSISPPKPPPLRQFSDWMFVVWKIFCDDDEDCIENLEWVIHTSVSNPSSIDVALLASGHELGTSLRDVEWPEYPGYQFEENTADETERDNFNALVGCPNGWGTAYMLQQRQSSFDSKVIDRVHIIGNDEDDLVILWHIGPAGTLPDDGNK